jgi:hypothetical protein
MREVAEEKRNIHFEKTNRVIDLKNCKPDDLMLCVKEN